MSDPSYLRCKKAFAANVGGRQVIVTEGRPVLADSAVVKAYPEFFESLDEFARRENTRRGGDLPSVEQATAAPGEKRTTARRGSTKDEPPTPKTSAKIAGPAKGEDDGEP